MEGERVMMRGMWSEWSQRGNSIALNTLSQVFRCSLCPLVLPAFDPLQHCPRRDCSKCGMGTASLVPRRHGHSRQTRNWRRSPSAPPPRWTSSNHSQQQRRPLMSQLLLKPQQVSLSASFLSCASRSRQMCCPGQKNRPPSRSSNSLHSAFIRPACRSDRHKVKAKMLQ